MKVLLDQNMPRDLIQHLVFHEVTRAYQLGWAEFKNGMPLQASKDAGFQVLVTGDKNIQYQQNLSQRHIAIIVLSNTNWPFVQPHLQQIMSAVDTAVKGSFHIVICERPSSIPKYKR